MLVMSFVALIVAVGSLTLFWVTFSLDYLGFHY